MKPKAILIKELSADRRLTRNAFAALNTTLRAVMGLLCLFFVVWLAVTIIEMVRPVSVRIVQAKQQDHCIPYPSLHYFCEPGELFPTYRK
jgi:hypothetical protein